MFGTIDMASKLDAFLSQLPQVRQAHHLIPAAVGEDRTIPVHEFVKATQAGHPFRTGTKHQVIGIAQNDVRARLAHSLRLQGLHRCCGPYRHECRGTDITPHHPNGPGARGAIAGVNVEGKSLHDQKP